MSKFFAFILFALLLPMAAAAQSSMTDEQVAKYIMEEYENGTSQQQILTKLIQRGVDVQQIRRVRRKYEAKASNSTLGMLGEDDDKTSNSRLRQNNGQGKSTAKTTQKDQSTYYTGRVQKPRQAYAEEYDDTDEDYIKMQTELDLLLPTDTATMLKRLIAEREKDRKRVFGRDIFNNKDLTFEPNMNIATPQNYVVGPGDEVIIDIYGASQKTVNATVSPDGDITIEGFGPIAVSGLTVSQANARIKAQLGQRYSSSKIKTTLGQTRTITVNVMGEVVVPGTYTLSAFASVFHALYMAGGTNEIGTLRNIKVFRRNKLLSKVDIYDYIINGKLTGNVRLSDGDVISVEPYDCLVSVSGKVKRPMYYEMKKKESIQTLLNYAGGFTGDAYKKSVRVVRKTGREFSVYNVGEFEMAQFQVADGDSVSIDSIIQRYANTVEVKGSVFRPGLYQLGGEINSVRTLVEHAEGLREEAFTARAVMHRMKADRTLEVLSVDLGGIMNGTAPDVALRENDVLFVPTKAEIQTKRTITIHGEVQFPGTYQYAENGTLEDFILQAGGLNDAASTVKVDVSRRIVDPLALTTDSVIAQTYSFALKEGFVVDGEQGFTLMPFDEVYVRKSPGYNTQKNVSVEGNVMFAGSYTLSSSVERLSDIIKKAGGVSDRAYVAGARLERQFTTEEQMRNETLLKLIASQSGDTINIKKLQIGNSYSVGIELDKALATPHGDADIILREGDRIVVPEYNGTVKISGDVLFPNSVTYEKGKPISYYIDQAGGWGSRAKKRNTYIIYMNGTVAKIGRGTKVMPGCEIVVPSKRKSDGRSLSQLLAVGSTTASIATMLVTIATLIK